MVDVHRDDRQRDRCAGRRIELCSDKSHAIASLGQAESPFYFDTIRVIQIGVPRVAVLLSPCVKTLSPEPGSASFHVPHM